MSLRGNLKEFSISEIFQILSLGHKTGVLRIKSQDEGAIYFRNGEGYFATSTKYHKLIGQRLVETGLISRVNLDKALDAQKEEYAGWRLGRILLEMGLIDAKGLEAFIKEQIWDAFLDILTWEEGEFEFEVGTVPTEEDIGVTFDAWNRLVDQVPSFEKVVKSEYWAKIKEAIPSFDTVFALDRKKASDAVGVSLAPNEWGLVCLIDGTKTVAELIQEYGKDSFQAGYTFYKLLTSGLITEVSEKKSFASMAEPEKKQGWEQPSDEKKRTDVPENNPPLEEVSKTNELEREAVEEEKAIPDKNKGPESIASSKKPRDQKSQAEAEAGKEEKKDEQDDKRFGEAKDKERQAENAQKDEDVKVKEQKASDEKAKPGEEKQLEPIKLDSRRAELEEEKKKGEGPQSSNNSNEEAATSKQDGESKGECVSEDSNEEVAPGSIEVKSLGNLEVWVGKEKRFADLFIIKKGDKASNVLRFPDGKFQFVHDRFSPEEKKIILEKIAAKKKEESKTA